MSTAGQVRRAPRLSPDESIAPLLHRTGRFARIDPQVGGRLPSWSAAVGVLAWAGFTAGCLWRAWASHADADTQG